ncbi:MAG: NAD(P)-dependent oxidoreductase [Rhodospirillales bacterium]|nr:NAD(P)-dependent oxidoreductase [Rhodospirillales bacterium]
MSDRSYRKILLTGAAGQLGRYLRPQMAALWPLRSSDIADLGRAHANEECVRCDLADRAAVDALVADCDAIVHFGGISVEAEFDALLAANIAGTYNVFGAARRHGVRRVVYASSNHVIGFYGRGERIDADAPVRPDTLYGVSKAYGEALGRYYADKFGLEIACLRIGTAAERPAAMRQLSTWLSHPDLLRLIRACLNAPRFGFAIVYGQSANDRGWWDNAKAAPIGFDPHDNAEVFAETILRAGPPVDPDDPAVKFQGGDFAAAGYVQR